MSSEERYATLTAGLLARKGDAEPALEPFAHARVAESARRMTPGSVHKLQRGHNDPEPTEPYPQNPQQPQSEPRPEAEAPQEPAAAATPAFRSEPRDVSRQDFLSRRAAVTFRMPTHDFLRLKLASAELAMSCQNIILAALEAYLDKHGVERLNDCNCLKEAARLSSQASAAPR